MLGSFKRKRIASERVQAVDERYRAAQDFVAALREAEAALEALKLANDRFYKSDNDRLQHSLSELRRSRERMFAFHAAAEVIEEAPRLARILNVRIGATRAMPFSEFIAHTSKLDLPAGDQPQGA